MRRIWTEPESTELPADLQETVGGHPLVTRGLINRGISSVEEAVPFLFADRYVATLPLEMPGIERAVERIEQAIERQEQICVWGDFDVDGQTATTILVSTFKELGAHASFYIPHRVSESHGLNQAGVRRLVEEGVGLIVTCDTGIRDTEAVELAANLGTDVIITDHHDLPDDLPSAVAISNPKLLSEGHPFRELPGVGVAYLLAWALLLGRELGEDTHALLDLVALGIVADLARLSGETRYYLQLGLERLRKTSRLGLVALMEVANMIPEALSENDIGFAIAPRMNSLGRLSDANRAVDLLTTSDPELARSMAEELEGLNARRRLLTDQVLQASISQIEKRSDVKDHPAIVLDHDQWPEGVIGLVAGRLADRYNKPVILIAEGQDGLGRASARSVPGIDITAAIEANGTLLERFGGHPMAGGFAIRNNRIHEFRAGLYRTLRDAEPIRPSLHIDGFVSLNELTLDLVHDLERLAPFGPGNPSFVLVARDLAIHAVKALGRSSDHLQVNVADRRGNEARVIWWRGAREAIPEGAFDLAMRPRSRYYQGEQEIQLEWIDVRQTKEPVPAVARVRSPKIVDARMEEQPTEVVKRLGMRGVQILNEAVSQDDLAVHTRLDLEPSIELAIWTIPPGSVELRSALQRVKPETLHLFAGDQNDRSASAFVERLIGLAKFATNQKGGDFDIPRAAAALGHRDLTIETGIKWLADQGVIELEQTDRERWKIRTIDQKRLELNLSNTDLERLLRETAAFREYWRNASIVSLRRLLA